MPTTSEAPLDLAADFHRTVSAVAAVFDVSEEKLSQHPAGEKILALIKEMIYGGRESTDPMREIFARLGDKWSMLLLLTLRTGTCRHSTLRRLAGVLGADPGISQRMLTLRLRSLERDGLIDRFVTPTVPPRVDYTLSVLGHDLLRQVDSLMNWVRCHGDDIRAARAAFERHAHE